MSLCFPRGSNKVPTSRVESVTSCKSGAFLSPVSCLVSQFSSQGLPSRYVSSSVEGLSKFSKGIATFHGSDAGRRLCSTPFLADGQEPRKLGVEGAPWLSDKSMDVGIPQCEDWNSLSVELTSGKRRSLCR